jgi:hypothetical protein
MMDYSAHFPVVESQGWLDDILDAVRTPSEVRPTYWRQRLAQGPALGLLDRARSLLKAMDDDPRQIAMDLDEFRAVLLEVKWEACMLHMNDWRVLHRLRSDWACVADTRSVLKDSISLLNSVFSLE